MNEEKDEYTREELEILLNEKFVYLKEGSAASGDIQGSVMSNASD